ncbi:CehA/McbA family metallohydrolase [Pseudoteredinibacter isoporae]|uniref:CehA/McbA family metallohydrolase n=1 Tax=Pseudoteredinibacter isoporae TaxID=570281 RepID=UPI003108459D
MRSRLGKMLPLLFITPMCWGDYQAQQIQQAEQIRVAGDMAWGGIKDWQLSNGRVCAVISDVKHEGELAATGGYLTDFGFCQQPGEGFGQLYFAINLSGTSSPAFYKMEAQQGDDFARVLGWAKHGGFELQVSYELNEDNADKLQIKAELSHKEDVDGFDAAAFGLVNLNRGNKVFSTSLDGQGPSPAYEHKPLPSGLLDDLGGLVGVDMILSLPDAGKHPMVYGQHIKNAYLLSENGEKSQLPSFVGVTESYSAALTFTESFVFDNDGVFLDPLKLLETQMADLELGETLVVEHEISLASGRDAASVLNQYWDKQPAVKLQLPTAGLSVFMQREADGAVINHAISDVDGRIALRAPAGKYRLRIEAQGRVLAEQAVDLQADIDLPSPELKAQGTLRLPRGQTMRLSFFPEEGQSVNFSRQPFGFSTGGHREAPVIDVMLAGTESDPDVISLAPGRYRVLASRGPEYSAHMVKLTIDATKESKLSITVPKVEVATPNYVHADLHTHAAPSFDNSYPQEQRIRSYVAQGGEVLVATEHETIYDYHRDIAEMGLSDRLATVTGTEITGLVQSEVAPHTLGHANAFPLQMQKGQYRSGAPAHENKRWRDVIAAVRKSDPDAVMQLNHPRVIYQAGEISEPGSQRYNESYLMHLLDGRGHDPSQPLTAEQNRSLIEKDPETGVRDIDFDAMELINGTGAGLNSYEQLRKDWFAFLKQGVRLVGTATSDSHGQTYGEVVLEPRTLIYMANDDVSEFDQDHFIAGIKRGNMYGTTGPLLDIALRSGDQQAMMGETLGAKDAVLALTVNAAQWIDVHTLRIYINGELYQQMPINKGQENLLPLSFGKDSFVTVEVEGDRKGLYAEIVPVMPPFAFSNPIYVDADQDGQWQAPGL